jgi:hypothetical protein
LNIVTSGGAAAQNFGMDELPPRGALCDGG